MALIVGAIEVGLGLAKLGFVADLLSQGGAGRVHERPRDHDHRRPAAQAVRVLHGCRRLRARDEGVRDGPRPDEPDRPCGRHRRRSPCCWSCPGSRRRSPRCWSRWSARPWSPVCSISVPTVSSTVGALPQGLPGPTIPSVPVSDLGPLLIAALGIVLVSLTDTIATSTSFAARRGDEVDPNQEMIGMGAANAAAGLFQGFAISASGSRTAVAEQSGSKSQVTGLVGAGIVAALLLFLPVAAAGPAADRPRRRGDRRRAVPAQPRGLAHVSGVSARPRCCSRSSRRCRRDPARRAAGDLDRRGPVDPAVLPPQLVAARARCSGACPALDGWHGIDRYPEAEQPSRASWCTGGRRRCSSRTRASSASRCVTSCTGDRAAVDRAAVRGGHRHRRHRGRHARAARHRAERRKGSTSRSSSCGAGSRTCCSATACSPRSIDEHVSTRRSTRRSRRISADGSLSPGTGTGRPRTIAPERPGCSAAIRAESAAGE